MINKVTDTITNKIYVLRDIAVILDRDSKFCDSLKQEEFIK